MTQISSVGRPDGRGTAAGSLRAQARLLLTGEAGLAAVRWLLFAYMAGYFWPPANHDVAYLIDTARRWLDGARLYVDVIEVNAPLAVVIHAVPVLLEHLTGIAATTWFVALTIAGVIAAATACRHLLRHSSIGQGPLSRAAVPLVVLFLLACAQTQEFSQREHLMLMAGFPYLLLADARLAGRAPRWSGLAIGLAAGLAFAIKPHFLIIPLLIEGYVLLRRGRAAFGDPVPWLIALGAAGHAALIWLVFPEYLTVTMPITIGAYLNMGAGPLAILFGSAMSATTVLLCILLPVVLLRGRPGHVLIALFAAGATAMCVAQGKGWGYHTMPAVSATLLLLAVLVLDQLDRWTGAEPQAADAPPRRAVLVAVISLLGLIAYPYFLVNAPFAYQLRYQGSIARQLGDVIAVEAPNRRIASFSPGVYPFFPTVEYESTEIIGRFMTMWPIQGLYAECLPGGQLYRPVQAMPPIEKQVFEWIVQDFVRGKPDIIFFDRIPGIPRCTTEVFSYRDYFSRDPRFAAALKDYEFAYEFDRYNLWRRKRS